MADIEYDAYEEGFDKGREDGLQQGLEPGAYQNKLEMAKNLLSMGLSPDNLPLETVCELAREL